MKEIHEVSVLEVKHWNETLFSFKTERPRSLTFENGQFLMIGLRHNNKNIMRAYSVVSANYEDYLEFFSIKVDNGELTSKLQHTKAGDKVLVGSKPHGTLVDGYLLEGENLYLISTGTGLAPFLSIIKDPFIYEKYKKIILVHGCRYANELAYSDFILDELPRNEYFGDLVKEKLIYYPATTRDETRNMGRVTELVETGRLFRDLNLSLIDIKKDRFMICGNQHMLKDFTEILTRKGLSEGNSGTKGEFVTERAFVQR